MEKIDKASESICEDPTKLCKKFLKPSDDSQEILAYQNSVMERIHKKGQENFPHDLVPEGVKELILFSLQLEPDGKIHELRLLSESSFEKINKYVIATIMAAAPYPKFNKIFSNETDIVVISKTIVFSNLKNVENAEKSN